MVFVLCPYTQQTIQNKYKCYSPHIYTKICNLSGIRTRTVFFRVFYLFFGRALATSRYARVGKVGVLRATLTLRCYAALRTVLTHALRMPHANGILVFYLVFIHVLALSCLMLIIKHL
ncbi:MAG: hypothetical protein NZ455_14290 [Bacteroidia bacterium]|nr:hypothetical protein [Bacteroidia bacterium]MDW8347327.1 hypothetical protein [Bacteroidia bacterium]